MEIKTIKESLERLQLLVDKDIIHVRPSDMDEFLSQWQQAMKDIRKALHQQEQAEPVGHVFPDDIKMLETEECCVGCYSVALEHPEYGKTEPLYRHPLSVVPEALIDALKSHSQGDEEGVMCIVSRQAVCEAVDILEALSAAPQPKETGE